jgi:hypothetical protein
LRLRPGLPRPGLSLSYTRILALRFVDQSGQALVFEAKPPLSINF